MSREPLSLTDVIRDALRGEKDENAVTDDELARAWDDPELGDVLLAAGAWCPFDEVVQQCGLVLEMVLRSQLLAGKSAAARRRAELVKDVHRTTIDGCDRERRLELMHALRTARANKYEVQEALGSARHLLEVHEELEATSPRRYSLATAARMVGVAAERALGDVPELRQTTHALKQRVPAPTASALCALAEHAPSLEFIARDPLHALVDALLHGPAPLAAHLREASWTDETLVDAWTRAMHLDVVFSLAALCVDQEAFDNAMRRALATSSLPSHLLPPRAVRALANADDAFVRAFAAWEIGVVTGLDQSLAATFRAALAAADTKSFLWWLELFTERDQGSAARSLKRYLG